MSVWDSSVLEDAHVKKKGDHVSTHTHREEEVDPPIMSLLGGCQEVVPPLSLLGGCRVGSVEIPMWVCVHTTNGVTRVGVYMR